MKLAKLPDRNPVRLTFSALPDLNAALQAYAEAYEAAYGQAVSVADLIPAMLEGYLESDRDFAKARKVAATPVQGGATREPSSPKARVRGDAS